MATVPTVRVELAVLVASEEVLLYVYVVAFRKASLTNNSKKERPVQESQDHIQCSEQGLRRNDVGLSGLLRTPRCPRIVWNSSLLAQDDQISRGTGYDK